MLLDYGMLMLRLRRKPILLMWFYKFLSSSFLAAREYFFVFCVGWLISAEKSSDFSSYLSIYSWVGVSYVMLQKNKHSIPKRLKHHHRLAARASLSWSIAKSHVNSIVQSALTFTKKIFVQSISICIIYTPAGLEEDSSHCQLGLLSVSQKAKKNMKKKEVQIAIFSWCESETLKILMTKMSLFLNLLFFISIEMVDCCRVVACL